MTAPSYPQIWFTYGPHTKDDSTLTELFVAGATGVRLTFSYGTPALQLDRARQIRRVASQIGVQPLIIADLQGEKCRFAMVPGQDEISVKRGDALTLTRSQMASISPLTLPLQIPEYIDTLAPGDIVLEGDGALWLQVVEIGPGGAACQVGVDGVIHPGRGIVVQKSTFRPRSLTEKDVSDLNAIAESRLFDAVAISFVAGPKDIQAARAIMAQRGEVLPVVAKIETESGIDNVEEIGTETDILMAARGDLALSRPWVELAEGVSVIARAAEQAGKPWILATQIAEGLERFAFLTRAEICDLAHWMSVGAHGAMLSYETAFGPRPVEAVRCVKKVIQRYRMAVNPSSAIGDN